MVRFFMNIACSIWKVMASGAAQKLCITSVTGTEEGRHRHSVPRRGLDRLPAEVAGRRDDEDDREQLSSGEHGILHGGLLYRVMVPTISG
jgi:hypothetical protein